MNTLNGLLLSVVLLLIVLAPPVSTATQTGGGYGRQLLGNTDLEQYEIVVREPLPYKMILGDTCLVSSDVEIGMAIIRDSGDDPSEVGRFLFMPQLGVRPYDRVQFVIGLGTGFMGGETKFTKHDLGGPFFLASKLGLRFFFGEGWGVEYVYYHQSNAGIYENNASLNMQQLALFSTF
jgi:hypothetical protein